MLIVRADRALLWRRLSLSGLRGHRAAVASIERAASGLRYGAVFVTELMPLRVVPRVLPLENMDTHEEMVRLRN